MSTTQRMLAAVLVMTSALGPVAACRGCDHDAPSSPDAAADAPAPDANAGDAAAGNPATEAGPPYLPARALPDDSPGRMSVVEYALFALRPQLNVCYRTAAKDHPKLEGEAILAVTIGGDGHVTDVATVSQKGLDAAMLGCLTSVMKNAVFPPPGDGGRAGINVPLTFRPPTIAPDGGPASHDAGIGRPDAAR